MARGLLRIYLGAAPGVGKTVAMLSEAQRRRDRGTDVVVGLVETHGRAYTTSMLEGLEVLPRVRVQHGDTWLEELDVDAVLRRRPEVVLVDELAHTNASGSRHERRWEDIEQLLDAGIDVISTVNVQHLESLNDVVREITGVRQRETVPDEVVRAADQIELVDMSPEALRRRLAHGNVYPAERVDAALSHYFRPGNLSALRELALLWVADRVDEALTRYRHDQDIDRTWATRERVVVALTGGPEQEVLLRRGARIASRGAGGQLLAVKVVPDSGLRDVGDDSISAARELTRELGGELHVVTGSDISAAILDFARSVNASQIIVGASSRGRWRALVSRGVGEQVVAGSGEIDVLMVTHPYTSRRARARGRTPVGRARAISGWLLATVGTAALTWALAATRPQHDLPLEVLLFLLLTVATAIVGGLVPALLAAVLASIALNWYFTPPFNTLTINEPQNAVALAVFVLVAVSVASVVHLSARRTAEAVAAQRSSRILADLSHSLLDAERPLSALLDQARDIFGSSGAAVVRRARSGGLGDPVVISGEVPLRDPGADLTTAAIDDGHVLVLARGDRRADERDLVEAFAHHAAAVMRGQRLSEAASAAQHLARDNRARGALLAAVSHDLRTPLAAIKAGVSSLRSRDVVLGADDQAELLEMVEESSDRLDALIENLLDMSRIQTDTVTPRTDEVLAHDLLEAARHGVSDPDRVRLWQPEMHLTVVADAGLAERVLANLVENALRFSPGRQEVVMSAERLQQTLEVRVIDRGPGVPRDQKDGIFAPFQRYGDAPRGDGVGLGLAVARGLAEAMGGTLSAEDTPGGGLTMVLRLPLGTADPATAQGDSR
ncbi:ATP-binding protein [Luteipulveratus halotolerans]|uniref:histidine kinase n=1 Tax=Luteipulveratus halotolerans TaxID=1631356 RepID=A0A0L6CG53_9MICO|nr:ATP-binding protein [Luteipulveratus halotolerans]KNX36782.1 histidine kinase [Luteipulveratus halotolerans]